MQSAGGEKMLMDRRQIEGIIPHRDPFLLIDEIEEMVPGVSAIGYKYVKEDEPYFKGHFPNNPVMPGVLIVEALAQTGAVSILSEPGFVGKTAFMAQVDKCKFKRMVVPGDTLKLECEIIKRKGPIGIGKATATVNGELAVSAELTFAIK